MPRKKQMGGRRRRHHIQEGGNIFSDAWDGIKTAGNAVYKHVLKPVHKVVKDNKLISKGLRLIPDKRAQAGAVVADQLGYGKAKFRVQPIRSVAGTGQIRA